MYSKDEDKFAGKVNKIELQEEEDDEEEGGIGDTLLSTSAAAGACADHDGKVKEHTNGGCKSCADAAELINPATGAVLCDEPAIKEMCCKSCKKEKSKCANDDAAVKKFTEGMAKSCTVAMQMSYPDGRHACDEPVIMQLCCKSCHAFSKGGDAMRLASKAAGDVKSPTMRRAQQARKKGKKKYDPYAAAIDKDDGDADEDDDRGAAGGAAVRPASPLQPWHYLACAAAALGLSASVMALLGSSADSDGKGESAQAKKVRKARQKNRASAKKRT